MPIKDTDEIVVLNGIVYIKDVNTNTFSHGFIIKPLEKYTRENVIGNVRNITPDENGTPFNEAKRRIVSHGAIHFEAADAARQLFKSKTNKSEGRVVVIGGKRYIVGEKKTKKSNSKVKKSKSKKSKSKKSKSKVKKSVKKSKSKKSVKKSY